MTLTTLRIGDTMRLTETERACLRTSVAGAFRCASRLMLGSIVAMTLDSATHAQTPTLSLAPDSPRWLLEGRASVAEFQGRKSILLDGGAATIKDFEMRDGVIDVDVATPARRGFFGVQFRIGDDGNLAEWVYLRQHKSGEPDAVQYTPVLNTGLNWQLYNGAGFTGPTELPRDMWFHLRLEVTGAQAKLYVGDTSKPVLVMDDLKTGLQKGQVALAVLTGATYFSNFEVRTTPDAPWQRRLPVMPAGTLTQRGRNELMLAVSELGGGWGFICRVTDIGS